MKLDVQRMGSVLVLSPRGAVAQEDVEVFAAAVDEHRKRSNGRLVLELSQVPYFDSRGIETLWDFADRQQETGQSTRVASVGELCREIMELTGVAGQLDFYDNAESAVRSFL